MAHCHSLTRRLRIRSSAVMTRSWLNLWNMMWIYLHKIYLWMCLKDGVPCPCRWVVCPISACLCSSPTPAMNLIVAIQSCHHSLKIGDPRVPRLFQRSNRWMVELVYTLCRTLKSSKIYSYGPRLSDFTNTFIHEGNARISACTKRIHMNVLAYFNYIFFCLFFYHGLPSEL